MGLDVPVPSLEISNLSRLMVLLATPTRMVSSAAAQFPFVSALPILTRKPPTLGLSWLLNSVLIHCGVRTTFEIRISSAEPWKALDPSTRAPTVTFSAASVTGAPTAAAVAPYVVSCPSTKRRTPATFTEPSHVATTCCQELTPTWIKLLPDATSKPVVA